MFQFHLYRPRGAATDLMIHTYRGALSRTALIVACSLPPFGVCCLGLVMFSRQRDAEE